MQRLRVAAVADRNLYRGTGAGGEKGRRGEKEEEEEKEEEKVDGGFDHDARISKFPAFLRARARARSLLHSPVPVPVPSFFDSRGADNEAR